MISSIICDSCNDLKDNLNKLSFNTHDKPHISVYISNNCMPTTFKCAICSSIESGFRYIILQNDKNNAWAKQLINDDVKESDFDFVELCGDCAVEDNMLVEINNDVFNAIYTNLEHIGSCCEMCKNKTSPSCYRLFNTKKPNERLSRKLGNIDVIKIIAYRVSSNTHTVPTRVITTDSVKNYLQLKKIKETITKMNKMILLLSRGHDSEIKDDIKLLLRTKEEEEKEDLSGLVIIIKEEIKILVQKEEYDKLCKLTKIMKLKNSREIKKLLKKDFNYLFETKDK